MNKLKLIIALLLVNVVLSCTRINENREVSLILDQKAKLGEGALWDIENQRLLWVDIESGILNIFHPVQNENREVPVEQKIGTVVPLDGENAVVALEDGIYTLNLETEELTYKASPEDTSLNNRFNDGKCDPAGRFWVGTISGSKKNGGLYRVDPDFSYEKMIDSVQVSNGIVWSPDNKFMYYIDTPTREVVKYDYNNETGEISNPRAAISIHDTLGYPDGSTLDAEGKLWIAMWGGHAVTRWDPETGELLETIEVPAKNITSVAFGGEDLSTLYITTASVGMNDEERSKYPHAGGLFAVKPGVKGVPCSYFGRGD